MENDLSIKQANETSENNYLWIKLNLLQSYAIQCRLGQTVLRLLDKVLWIVEKCVEWSLPSEEIRKDENGKVVEKLELVRPLPWILFLPTLIILRTIRVLLNTVVFLLGFSIITASDMVKFIQKIRRYLIALKSSGTKERHCNKDKRSSMSEAKQMIRSIRLTLSSLSCLDTSKPSLSPPPTKIHISNALDLDAATTMSEEKSVTESMNSIERRGSTSSNESEQDEEKQKTLQEQLNQLTASDSSDSDYIYSSAGRDNSSLYPELDTSVSSSELNDIMQEFKEWHEEEGKKEQNQQFQDAERAAASAEKTAIYVEQIAADTEQAAADAEQTAANADQVAASTEQAAADAEQTAAANAEQVAADVEQAVADAEQATADTEQTTPKQKSTAKESRDKVEERHSSSRRIDSPEYHTSDRSSQEGDSIFYSPISSDSDTPKECSKLSAPIAEKPISEDSLKTAEFINGEIHFSSASAVSESKLPEKANNGAVMEKRGANANKYHKGKRTSHGNRRKK